MGGRDLTRKPLKAGEPLTMQEEATSRKQPTARSKRARSAQGKDTRAAILDATERIMLEGGYAAVSSREVGKKAGLKSQLLHYYFRTMDDLFIAVFQRMDDRFRDRFADAMKSDRPLMSLWKLNCDPAETALLTEFVALSTHCRAIRTLMARSTIQDRRMHIAALTLIMERRGIVDREMSPTVMAVMMAAMAHKLITEAVLGVSEGHAEMVAFVERYLRRLEGPGRGKGKSTEPPSVDGASRVKQAGPKPAVHRPRRSPRARSMNR